MPQARDRRCSQSLISRTGPTLTGREVQVLRRLADGQTNKQIARELGVTAKTIEFHVSKLLRKHGVESRFELMDTLVLSSHGEAEEISFIVTKGSRLHTVIDGIHRRCPANHPSCVVGVLIRDVEDRVLLDTTAAHAGQGLWGIPGVHVLFGETLRDAARRTVEEETGLEIRALQEIGTHEIVEDHMHLILVVFEAQADVGQESSGTWYTASEATKLALHPVGRDILGRYETRIEVVAE